jgi:hypothetical protein
MSKNTVSALKEAADGLLYMSETDEPFDVVHWGKATSDLAGEVRRRAGAAAEAGMKEITLDKFFGQLTDPPHADEDAAADAAQYRKLVGTIREHLNNVRVFRTGKVNIDIHIIGENTDHEWVGLKTKAVET